MRVQSVDNHDKVGGPNTCVKSESKMPEWVVRKVEVKVPIMEVVIRFN